MNDARLVRRGERTRNLNANVQHFIQLQRLRQTKPQRVSLNVFGGNEVSGFCLSNLIDGQDVRMIEGRSCLCFLLKAPQTDSVRRQFRRQELERHSSFQPSVFRKVDLAHPAGSEQLKDRVVIERLSRNQALLPARH